MSDTVIRVENVSKLYRLGEVGTGSLAHDVNRWWHKVRGKEDPYLKIGEVNDRTKSVSSVQRPESSAKKRSLTTDCSDGHGYGTSGVNQRADSGEFLEGHSQAGLQMDSEKLDSIRSANDPSRSGQQSRLNSESAKISEICGTPAENFNLKTENSSSKAQSDWVYALKDVSFEVKRGEVLGIIGRNGAGKSTLLKILSRVTTQSEGRIKVKGRIASLLEVGTGFHPELTGRENIFLNGAILGMRKAEIARKFDEIVEFSGCARYIDTPVKRYSSGMYVRLAFAVAAHLEPEILIVDEVLAVGDAEFQKKCLGKMKDVAGHGRTILFVSHQIPSVTRLCNRVIWMEKGGVKKSGPALDICNDYLATERPTLSTKTWTDESSFPGNSWVRLESVTARGGADDPTVFPISQPVELEIGYQVIKSGKVLIPNIHFYSSEGALIFVSHDWQSGWRDRPREVGFYTTTFTIPSNFFCEGTISVTVAISSYNPFELHAYENEVVSFTMLDDLEDSDIRGDYTGRIPGLVRPLLKVETKLTNNIWL